MVDYFFHQSRLSNEFAKNIEWYCGMIINEFVLLYKSYAVAYFMALP
jgi:hypothetical protein